MSQDNKLQQELQEVTSYIKAKYPNFANIIGSAKIEFDTVDYCPTAFTDGQDIYINSDFWNSLQKDEKVFLFNIS